MTSERENEGSMSRLSEIFAALAVCIFIILAAYRIQLPGLYYDEVNFVNAAQGAPDNTFIYAKLGPIPLLIMPYLGALKAWIYAPIFYLFKVSPLTIRLPVILLAAVTLLILYRAVRHTIGALWDAIVVSIMAVDPANLFLSRLDWGPTVLMHFFQALILALLFSYRRQPQLWKARL
jgi:4-amino-4-deoxy-L-arabinose transferase-like glycosyltransferase